MYTSGIERVVTVLKAIAHPLRLRILAILSDGEEHVTGLAERLGVSRAAVSGALSLMRMARIVAVDRRDGHATYRLQDDGLRDLISWTRRPPAVRRVSKVGRRGAPSPRPEPQRALRGRTERTERSRVASGRGRSPPAERASFTT